MIYPAIICFMAVGATVFLLSFALPRFMALFAGKDALLPAPTLVLIALSNFLRSYWYLVVVGAGTLILGFNYVTRTSWGRPYWDTVKLRIPIFNRMLRAMYITQSVSTMGELVSAGAPMLDTLLITADISTNTLYKRMWQSVHNDVRRGTKIAQSLSGNPLMPPSVVQMISAGEESGTLGEVLRDVAEYYSDELRGAIKAVTTAIEPLMIVIMGVVVGFIVMSIILPIFKMSSLVR
jgi:type IV pilus assembly protein PilC